MQEINAEIIESDVRFYPEYNRSAIEFIYRCERGEGRLSFPLKNETMRELFDVFEMPFLNSLQGSYVRLLIDDNDKVKGMKHILHNKKTVNYEGSCI